MVHVSSSHAPVSNAFHEHDTAAKQSKRFFAIVPTKYIRTIHGLFHAAISTTALLLGNYLFAMQIVLNRQGGDEMLFAKKVFFLCNFFSGAITTLFFWNKVQSWQLATTSMKDKGLVAKQMQNFNRGRGVLVPVLLSIIPLTMYYKVAATLFPNDYFLSHVSELIASTTIVALAIKTFLLIRDYGRGLILVYGGYQGGLAATALISYNGSLTALFSSHPTLLDAYEKNAIMVLTCVQYGFFWYYFYSRRLVSKEFVQTACKNYHPIVALVYCGRMMADMWWSTSSLPLVTKVQSLLTTMLVFLFVFKIVKTQLSRVTVHIVRKATEQHPTDQQQKRSSSSALRRRSSSLFEVDGLRRLSKRRSSLFESVLD